MKYRITISRLNSTGVQLIEFNKLKVGRKLRFENESYTILTTKVGKGKTKYIK